MSELATTSATSTDATSRPSTPPSAATGTGGAGKDALSRASGFCLDIQGLRAIAVSMVVIYHLRPSLLPGGFAGVDVFFVISGYLITGHLWRGYRKTGSVSLLDFWGRRARRLVPAAALVLLVTWLVARVAEPVTELPDIAVQIRASALYFQNWQLASEAVNYLQSEGPATPVQHFWSLSVEEQFYLVWPLLFGAAALVAIVVARARGGRGGHHRPRRQPSPAAARRAGLVTVAVLTTALVGCSLAYSVYDTRTNPAAAYFVTTTRMWELGVGGLLAMVPDTYGRRIGRQGWLGWAGLAAVMVAAFTLSGTSPFPGWIALLPVLGAAAMIAGGSADGRLGPAPLTSARPLVFLGGISYSLYLWHWPIISLYSGWRGKAAGPAGRPGPGRRRRAAGLAHQGRGGGQGPAVAPAQRARLAVGGGCAGGRGPGRAGVGVPGQPVRLGGAAARQRLPGGGRARLGDGGRRPVGAFPAPDPGRGVRPAAVLA